MMRDRESRDRIVGELKQQIRMEKALLERSVLTRERPDEADRPFRAKKLSEVFKSMGF
jgi:hypothetical protein